MTTRRRIAWISLATVVALITAATVFLFHENWNWARGPISKFFRSTTQRELELQGDLRVRFGWNPQVEASRVRVTNPEWATDADFFHAEKVFLRLRLGALVRGKLILDQVRVEAAGLSLERASDGSTNWKFGSGDSTSEGEPFHWPGEISLEAFTLQYRDAAQERSYRAELDSVRSDRVGWSRLIAGSGRYDDQPLAFRAATLGAPEASLPIPLRLDARAGETRLSAAGRIDPGSGVDRLRARFELSGRSLDEIWQLAGVPLPRSPRFSIAGRLAYGERDLRLTRLRGMLGRSDLGGSVRIRFPPAARMQIDADLVSRTIDLDDFEGFWGRPPHEEKKDVVVPAGSPTSVFPDIPFHFPKLQVADANLRFRAGEITGRTILDHVRLDARLHEGVLDLKPLALGMSAGELEARATLDTRQPKTQLRSDFVLRHVQLATLLRRLGVEERGEGEFGGRATISASGNSLHDLASTLDGDLGVVLQGGRLSDPLLELVALHLGEYIFSKLEDDKSSAPIRCLVGLMDAKDGVLEARELLLDTRHVRITGTGTIDLARERLDLELRQRSKNFTVGALRTPIVIEGPFATRRAKLKAGPLLARGGAAAILGAAINPFAALLALVDPGTKDRPAACSEALAEYREIAASVDGKAPGASRKAAPAPAAGAN